MAGKRKPLADRFWPKVRRSAGGGCWEWTGATLPRGYGVMGSGGGAGNNIGAHRVSYELHKGPIPDGQLIMHTCDNPSCVNPEHLVAGSAQDNSWDMARKGRGNTVKLTASDVLAIRHSAGTHASLARDYNVSPETIGYIRRGLTWRHT